LQAFRHCGLDPQSPTPFVIVGIGKQNVLCHSHFMLPISFYQVAADDYVKRGLQVETRRVRRNDRGEVIAGRARNDERYGYYTGKKSGEKFRNLLFYSA